MMLMLELSNVRAPGGQSFSLRIFLGD